MLNQPTFNIWGMEISEPVVALTDFVVTLVCLFAWLQLSKRENTQTYFKYFKWYFLAMAITTFTGGLFGHAFLVMMGPIAKFPSWVMSIISITFLELGAIHLSRKQTGERNFSMLKGLSFIKLVFFLFITIYTYSFQYSGLHAATGLLLIVSPLLFLYYRNTKDEGTKIILFAMLFSVLTGVVFVKQISLHFWFTHHDVNHILMAIISYIIYLGVDKINEPAYQIANET